MTGSRLRSLFLGSTLRIVGTALLVVVLVLAGGLFTGVLGAPAVDDVQNRFGDVNETTTLVHTDLVVDNPNPFGVSLGGITVDYGVRMNDVRMANGSKSGIDLPRGESTVSLTTRMINERIPEWWVSHIRNDERTTLSVAADVSTLGLSIRVPEFSREITTDITSAFNESETREIDANLGFVSDPVLYLNETSGSFGSVTDAETPIELSFTVYNPKEYAIPLGELGYEITMNGVSVGEGESSRSFTIPPKTTTTIETTTTIDNDRLDDWWVTHLERNQVTDVTIDMYARFDLSSIGGGSAQVPLNEFTHRFETDFFGTKEQAAPIDGG